MDTFESIRRVASNLHAETVEQGADPWKPWAMANKAAAANGCVIEAVKPGSSSLNGGQGFYDPSNGSIVVERGAEGMQALLAAHEIGHAVIHKPTEPVVTTNSDPSRIPEPSSAVDKLTDYGVRERREVQMDLFAREFVLPRFWARKLFVEERLSAQVIAERSGLPYDVVAQQICDAVLLPEIPKIDPAPAKPEALNDSQKAAVVHDDTPFQLQAGPGTGKTKTLINRIEWLLEQKKVDPENILVLTFSNKAAGELTERLTARRPDAGAIWIGTFHAFGYDLLKRFAREAGLPDKPQLIDKVDAIELVERALPTLGLKHFRDLRDPTNDISEILRAISRAKDEVADATQYEALAQATLKRARALSGKPAEVAKAIERAERTCEAAKVYHVYEAGLRVKGLLDFGDLVMRPVTLFAQRPDILDAARAKHVHILVDEYQDVNRASVLLLKALAGDGRNLWVVGDARQSIYRFRGASSTNMAEFEKDFPAGRAKTLDTNYRSCAEIVNTFADFGDQMLASKGALELDLQADKGSCGQKPQFRDVERPEDEGAAVAAAIRELVDAGVPFKDQAVLCRGNKLLAKIAEELEERDIPVLYLGSLFEREEIKDLLSVLALVVDPRAASLPRIACMERYALSLSDVAALLKAAAEGGEPMAWCDPARLSDATSKASLARLAEDLASFDRQARPWSVLSALLLDRTDLARKLASSTRPRDRVRAIAIWQLLSFCRSLPPLTGAPITAFLERIRKVVLLSEERDLRQMPACEEAMDAVRLCTVHGAKGLEWEAVHIPRLNGRSFPSQGAPTVCYPPDDLVTGVSGYDLIKAGAREEEECLFFVALSRAKHHLRLYATKTSDSGGPRERSSFLKPVWHHLEEVTPVALDAPTPADASAHKVEVEFSPTFRASHDDIEMFAKCARRYLYTRLLRIPGRKLTSAFGRMHDVVYEVIRWLREHPDGQEASLDATTAKFDEVWSAFWVDTGAAPETYRQIGLELVGYLVETRQGSSHIKSEPVTFEVNGLEVVVTPDEVRRTAEGVRVRRVRTGQIKSNETDGYVYPLYKMAAEKLFGHDTVVQVVHLTDRQVSPIKYQKDTVPRRFEKIGGFTTSLLAGEFPPDPNDRVCPTCPHFFVCSALPVGRLVTD